MKTFGSRGIKVSRKNYQERIEVSKAATGVVIEVEAKHCPDTKLVVKCDGLNGKDHWVLEFVSGGKTREIGMIYGFGDSYDFVKRMK